VIALRPLRAEDADLLYPLIADRSITDTLLWDGPESLDEYRASCARIAALPHRFTIVADERAVGTISVRPAGVFVGNHASRRIFEKNGFQLEGTRRRAVRKRGRFVDEWLSGLLREELRDP
jgi:hypothetical protein